MAKEKEVVAEAYQVKVEKAKEVVVEACQVKVEKAKEEVVAKAKEAVVKVERDDQWTEEINQIMYLSRLI